MSSLIECSILQCTKAVFASVQRGIAQRGYWRALQGTAPRHDASKLIPFIFCLYFSLRRSSRAGATDDIFKRPHYSPFSALLKVSCSYRPVQSAIPSLPLSASFSPFMDSAVFDHLANA